MSHWFACEIEEVVRPRGAKAPTVRRLERGFARGESYGTRGFSIEAETGPFDDTTRTLASELECPETPSLVAVSPAVSVRALTRASAVSTGGAIRHELARFFALTDAGLTLIASPDSLATDLAFLAALARREPSEKVDPDSLPIAWQNGSAAVLFHEAIGHPAERALHPAAPGWLTVEDSPSSGELVRIGFDDVGGEVTKQVLTAGAAPAAWRRWSHRDVPAKRLTNLVVTGSGRRLAKLPDTRIDVQLVSDGWWDPSTDAVGLRVVAADLVDGGHRSALEPFVYAARRAELFPLLRGWFGELTRHPGVICGDEGVPLPVGSASVGIVTEAR
jgi:hypothetical protein